MGGRYLITGVQLGMLKDLVLTGFGNMAMKTLSEIENEQFIGVSNNSTFFDTQCLSRSYDFSRGLKQVTPNKKEKKSK